MMTLKSLCSLLIFLLPLGFSDAGQIEAFDKSFDEDRRFKALVGFEAFY